MPKIVDHERRREELSDAVLRLIVREGISAVTLRAVAKESQWSTGVIGYYFRDRHDMLIAALRRASYLQGVYFKRTRDAGGSALDQLQNLLAAGLPLDERRLALGYIFLFFYAEGAQDEASRKEVAEYLQNWRKVVSRTLTKAVEQGELAPDTSIEKSALQLVACADGLSVQALLDPDVLRSVREDPDIVVARVLRTVISSD